MSISRRSFLQFVGAGAVTTALNKSFAASLSKKEKPNIILCMADDQGWGDMHYNGHPVLKTPNFDAMASEAFKFDRFYAAAPVCSPTRGSVMTGRHPNRFGCFKWGHTLRPQEVTIAEALKKAGYVTGHFGKWHLGPVRKGSPLNPGHAGFDEWLSAPNFFDNDPILSREGKAVQTRGESSMVTVDAALQFIRTHAQGDKPFLAVVWFGSPHNPHRALEADRALYDDQPKNMQHFLGEITAMDRAFGKLRGSLKELGLKENTILWYTSDNGGLRTASSGGRGRKASVYEGGLRVPALIEWPKRIPAPRSNAFPASTCDIYPTVLDLAGIPSPHRHPLDGISLVPLINGKIKKRPKPIGFWNHPTRGRGTPSAKLMEELLKAQQEGTILSPHTFGPDAGKITEQYPLDAFPGHAAWLDWPWKLHRIEKKDSITWELYHLGNDPMETKNLAEKNPKQVKAMKPAFLTWLKSVVNSLNGKDYENASKTQ